MKSIYTFACAMLIMSLSAISQDPPKQELEVVDKSPIDPDRYKGIKRSPYLYKKFIAGKVFDKAEGYWVYIPLNYNGYSKQFEFEENGIASELNEKFYERIVMISGNFNPAYSPKYMSDSTVFVKGAHPNYPEDFYIEVFRKDDFAILKYFEIDLSERKVEDVGKTLVLKSFASRFRYFHVTGNVVKNIKLNKRGLEPLVDKETLSYMKKAKIKGDTEKDWVKALSYWANK